MSKETNPDQDSISQTSKQNDKPKRQYHVSRKVQAKRAAIKKASEAKRELEKAQKAVNKKRAKARATKAALHKVDDAVTGKGPAILTETDLKSVPKRVQEVAKEEEGILFRPNKGPQTAFLAAPEKEVLYGGAAGGGKSYAMIVDAIRDAHKGNHRALILRRTLAELTELLANARQLYPKAFPGAKFKESKSTWYFPSGATVLLSYVDRDIDVERYQGQAYTYIGIDELGQYPTPYVWNYLRSRLRTTDPTITPVMRACVDEGDVLTAAGWKRVQDVVVGEMVQSVTTDGTLVLKPVTSVSSYNISEKLTRVRKKNLYMSMTGDHRVVYKKHFSPDCEIARWNGIQSKSVEVVRTSENYDAIGFKPVGNFDSNTFAEFLGLYIAEGFFGKPRRGNYKVIITQNKEENHPFVHHVLSAYNFCYSKNGDFQITNKALWEYVKQFGKSHEKHFPRDFLQQATYSQLDLAFKAYILGDGNWQTENSCTAYTTSRQLVDDLQEIAVKLGYKTQYKKYVLEDKNHRDKYCVYFTKNSSTTKVDKNPTDRDDTVEEDYTGKVYCITVEGTENFILRQKTFVWVSGNTANPGGIGSWWVKKMFVDPAEWGKPFWATDIDTGKTLVYGSRHAKAGQPLFQRRFIPAKLHDNPYLTESDDYEANLLSLPEVERRRLLEGDWDVVEGAAFSEFEKSVHVIPQEELPYNWVRVRGGDYGFTAPSCILWGAIDWDGNIIVYRELYQTGLTGEALGRRIREMESMDPVIEVGHLDPACWNKTGHGPSIAEAMFAANVRWIRATNDRIPGKIEVHRRLALDDHGQPRIRIMDNCVNLIRSLPSLPLSKTNPEDVDTKADDHAYDALRYLCMGRPVGRVPIHNRRPTNESRPQAFDSTFGY